MPWRPLARAVMARELLRRQGGGVLGIPAGEKQLGGSNVAHDRSDDAVDRHDLGTHFGRRRRFDGLASRNALLQYLGVIQPMPYNLPRSTAACALAA